MAEETSAPELSELADRAARSVREIAEVAVGLGIGAFSTSNLTAMQTIAQPEESGRVNAANQFLRNLGISAEDWDRFKGTLTGGNASAIETNLPAEYRELVGRYFQVIAKEAGKKK